MLKTLIDIIQSLAIVDGKLSAMTENQLDEFARNIPDGKISCNVFGIGGYDRTDSGVLRKQVRICLLRQMPVNFDLADVDLWEVDMSTKLMLIRDALDDSQFINIENPTEITPELLKYDRTVLLTYFDVALFGNTTICGTDQCVPGFLKEYVDNRLEGYVDDPDYVHTDNNYTTAEKNKLALYPATPPNDYPYKVTIEKLNTKWVDGWLWIDTGSKTNLKKVEIGYLAINTGQGTEQLKPIVHYPAALTYKFSSIPNGFYLKDEDGRLSENTDFEFIDIRYNILNDTVNKFDGTIFKYGHNAIFDESAGEAYHSASGVKTFQAVYPDFTGNLIQSVLDPLTNYSAVNYFYTTTYCKIKNANILSRPYVNAAITEQAESNPDLLTIASHYENTFKRRDITANANTFLKNVIAIGSCQATGIPVTGTSYGYGMEFAEVGNNLGLNAAYPNVTFPLIVAWGSLSPDGLTITNTHPKRSFLNLLQISNGAKIGIGTDTEITQIRTISTILSATQLTVTEAFEPFIGTMYIYIPEALIGTVWQPVANNQDYYQSPVASIIMAKFRKIQDATGANWHICRMAARATASNNGIWDMYRGFGIIDVQAAIQYIKDNYTENDDYLNALADDVERTRGIDQMLPYEKQTDDTPIAKRDFKHENLEEKNIETNYQHLDTTTEKITPIDADSVGLWNSVLGKFVLTTLTNLKAFLKTHFDGLYTPKNTAMYKLINDNTGYSHTGNTYSTVLKSVVIPANTLKSDSTIWFNFVIKWTNNANIKTFRINFNNNIVIARLESTSVMRQLHLPVRLKNGQAQIVGQTFNSGQALIGSATNDTDVTYVNFGGIAADLTIAFEVKLATSTDVASFEAINIMIEP